MLGIVLSHSNIWGKGRPGRCRFRGVFVCVVLLCFHSTKLNLIAQSSDSLTTAELETILAEQKASKQQLEDKLRALGQAEAARWDTEQKKLANYLLVMGQAEAARWDTEQKKLANYLLVKTSKNIVRQMKMKRRERTGRERRERRERSRKKIIQWGRMMRTVLMH
jgi:hypothetical protein